MTGDLSRALGARMNLYLAVCVRWREALSDHGIDLALLTTHEHDRLLDAYVAFAYPPPNDEATKDIGAERLIVLGHQLDREALQALLVLGGREEQVLAFFQSEDRRTGGRPKLCM